MVWNLCVRLKGSNFIPFRLKQAYFFSFIKFVIFLSLYCFQGPVYHFTSFSWNYWTNNAQYFYTRN